MGAPQSRLFSFSRHDETSIQEMESGMTLDSAGWFVWALASLWATVQTGCDFEFWLATFAIALFAAICVNDLWIASERSDESK